MRASEKTTNIVIAALGGEGGGTLVAWLEDVAYNAGWYAQATSIAGVAQRTGATIYYIELFPGRDSSKFDRTESGRTDSGRTPIMSMFPAPGDIDIAISSEIAEAGRLIQRGFCTQDRTTLIASDHHVYGITEKIVLHDGRADTTEIARVAAQQCKKLISYDMRELAEQNNTVISATLFGALAGSKALPFSKAEYQAVIAEGGKMVENNLGAFNASYNKAIAPSLVLESASPSPVDRVTSSDKGQDSEHAFRLPTPTTSDGADLLARVAKTFPISCHEYLTLGIKKLLDYQDAKYAHQYLDDVETVFKADTGAENHQLSRETARHLALWMSYEDTARVAQIKTRSTRQDKIRSEVLAADDQIIHLSEFFAPRLEELCQPLPAGLARAIIGSPTCRKLARPFTKGKRLRTDTISSFSVLRMMAFSRKWRRKNYSYKHEHQQIQNWLTQIKNYAQHDPQAASEIAESARIVKGYGKTRERGSEQIKRLLEACFDKRLSASQIKQISKAALDDDSNTSFDTALNAL